MSQHVTDYCKRILSLIRVVSGVSQTNVTLTYNKEGGPTPWTASCGGLRCVGATEAEAIHAVFTDLKSKATGQLAEAKAHAERIVEALEGGK